MQDPAFVTPFSRLHSRSKEWISGSEVQYQACPLFQRPISRVRFVQHAAVMVAQSGTSTVQRKMSTKTYRYTDPRGRAWTYEGDIIEAQNGGAGDAVIVCLHVPGSVGLTRQYWDRFFDMVKGQNKLSKYSIARFDWVGTGVSSPKADSLDKPYDGNYWASQLAHFVGRLGSPVVLLAQGASECMAVQFAAQSPSALRHLVIATGLSNKSVTTKRPDHQTSFSYNLLRGPLGVAFWNIIRNDWFISGFSQKNLLVNKDHLDQWVSAAVNGSSDDRIRFSLYSVLSGSLYDDYTPDYGRIKVPCAFFCGPIPSNRSVKNRVQSTRIPIPFLIPENRLHDEKIERLDLRCKLIPDCKGVIIDEAGPEMFFEQVEHAIPKLEDCLQEWSPH